MVVSLVAYFFWPTLYIVCRIFSSTFGQPTVSRSSVAAGTKQYSFYSRNRDFGNSKVLNHVDCDYS